MKPEEYFKTINNELARIKVLIDTENSLNLNDKNIFLEDIIANILNILYDISLVNTNLDISNYPSIDLKEEHKKVAVQVTTNVKRKKIQDTLNTFFKKGYNTIFNKLFIIVFDNTDYKEEFILKCGFKFTIANNIITYKKLLNLIEHSGEEKLKKIYNYVLTSLKENIYNVDWAIKNTVKSLNNLGKRYNKKLNVYNVEERKIKMFFLLEESKEEILKLINDTMIFIENNDINTELDLTKITVNFNKENLDEIMSIFKVAKDQIIKKYESSTNDYNKIYAFENKYNILVTEIQNLINAYFSKILIYKGVAGIGKSHTLAYFVNEYYITKKQPALLVLGQDFCNSENIEIQFCKMTGGKDNFDELLANLDQLGQIRNIIIPIVIDGLNESCDKNVWKKGLINFTREILKYPNLKLVLSIRDTYFDFCIPSEFQDDKEILFYKHDGFDTNSLEAIEEFFAHYSIKMPLFQIINNEFKNPLFLTIYCEIVSKYHLEINENNYKNFIDIYEEYLSKINQIFIEKYNLLDKPNIINKILNQYIKVWTENNKNLSNEEFLDVLTPISDSYSINKNEILNFIIENGLFYKENNYYGEVIIFTYERYEKISLARYILESINNIEELKNSINGGILKQYVDLSEKFDNGILEELISIIQTRFKVDFISLISFDRIKFDYYIKKGYIKSLIWYTGGYSKDIIIDNLKKLLKEEDYFNDILDTFIKMTYLENNPLNINLLNDYLLKLSMPQLDYNWSIVIDAYYSDFNKESIDNIVNYCLKYGSKYLNENTLYLIALLFSWMLSSSNRYLRDISTKALTKILLNNHKLSIKILENFKNVHDMYVLERIVAAIYGSVMRSMNSNHIEELSKKLYSVIYQNDRTIDNIIIKIYARKIFAFIKEKYSINLYDNIDNEKKSKWYDNLPTNEEIDKYKFDFEEAKEDKRKFVNSTIISSMVTEYGRGTSCYGDFGRYVLQRFLNPFEYLFDDIQLLANQATKRVFEYGYDYKLFGAYDSAVKYYQSRHEHSTERVGKKYQWIATYELLSKLYDNFIPHYDFYSDDIVDFDNREYFDKNHIRTYNKSDIEYVRYNLEEEFNGLLAIDTTNFILNQQNKENYLDTITFNFKVEEDYSKYAIKEINNIKYFDLFNLYSAEDRRFNLKNVDRNSLTIVCTAFVYSDREKLKKSNYKEYSQGTYNEAYNIQLFDIPNSSEYIINYNRKFQNQNSNDNYRTCYDEYIWEKEYDESIENSIKLVVPQKWIVDEFDLKQKNEGEWYNDDGLYCFQPSVDDGKQELVIRYDVFVEYLIKHNLNLGWTIYCEKSHNNSHVSWRVNLFYNHKTKKFNTEVYDIEEWESKPLF